MRKKSVNYSTPDAGGWMHAADDLFLARFRGRPCEICGATNGVFNGRTTRSMGHHILSKELHRKYRYHEDNITTLCPAHHLGAEMSPHSHDGAAQAAFYKWLEENRPEKYALMEERRFDKFAKEWFYRGVYEDLGGEIHSKTGKMKDLRPLNHKTKVREIEGAGR